MKGQWIWIVSLFFVSPLWAAEEIQSEIDPTLFDYEADRPSFALGLSGTSDGLGSQNFNTGNFKNFTLLTVGANFEFQPPWTQQFGVLSFGPHVAYHPIAGNGTVGLTNLESAFSYGGVARYQFRYFSGQPVVPMLGYTYDFWHYKLRRRGNGRFRSHGPIAGIWIYLNIIEKIAARSIYSKYGISRAYLTAELRRTEGENDVVGLSGDSYHLGLRIEY